MRKTGESGSPVARGWDLERTEDTFPFRIPLHSLQTGNRLTWLLSFGVRHLLSFRHTSHAKGPSPLEEAYAVDVKYSPTKNDTRRALDREDSSPARAVTAAGKSTPGKGSAKLVYDLEVANCKMSMGTASDVDGAMQIREPAEERAVAGAGAGGDGALPSNYHVVSSCRDSMANPYGTVEATEASQGGGGSYEEERAEIRKEWYWSAEEDEELQQRAKLHGEGNWGAILENSVILRDRYSMTASGMLLDLVRLAALRNVHRM